MVLQYKGFNNNWCYTEAETISWAIVNIDDIVKDYRQKNNSVEVIQRLYKEVQDFIAAETKWCGEIAFLFIRDITELSNIAVMMLSRKHDPVAYVTEKNPAYILNSEGKTIQRIN